LTEGARAEKGAKRHIRYFIWGKLKKERLLEQQNTPLLNAFSREKKGIPSH